MPQRNIEEEKERTYQKIDFQVHFGKFKTRRILIHKVQFQKIKIKYAGQELGLNESTAKRIIKIYRTEGKITKFKNQKKTKTKTVKIEQKEPVRESKLQEKPQIVKTEEIQQYEQDAPQIKIQYNEREFQVFQSQFPSYQMMCLPWGFYYPQQH